MKGKQLKKSSKRSINRTLRYLRKHWWKVMVAGVAGAALAALSQRQSGFAIANPLIF